MTDNGERIIETLKQIQRDRQKAKMIKQSESQYSQYRGVRKAQRYHGKDAGWN